MIWIKNFPLPPSVNEYLMPVAGRLSRTKKGVLYRKGKLVKTKIHANYLELCQWWSIQNKVSLTAVVSELHALKARTELEKTPFALRVDCFFAFHHERIFTVNKKCLQLDANNRLKPLLDALVAVLKIDDKHYFGGNCEKITTRAKEQECTIIRISPMSPRTLDELNLQISREVSTQGSLSCK